MKTIVRCMALLISVLLLIGCLAGCNRQKPERPLRDHVPIDAETVDRYIRLDRYLGLEIPLEAGAAKGTTVWRYLVDRAEVICYPEEQLAYYEAQERAKYRFLGKEVSDEVILREAEALVKEDLVLAYILRDTGLTLTEEERSAHFDRYVEKYVQTYGYSADYVRSSMRELVYESMLYDKTLEYLILNNSFVPAETK